MKNGLFKLIAVALILSLLASMVMAVGTESSVNSNSSLTPETIFTGDPSEPEEDATQESTESEDPTESLIPTESEEPTAPTEPGDGSHTSTEPTESESEPVDPTDPEEEPEVPTEATEPTTETDPSEEDSTTDPTDPEGEPEEPTEPTEPEEELEEPTESKEPTESEDPTEPEKPQYIYPDDWSRPALVFAVENGILQGDQNYNLNPDKNMTRAQMAAVLTRLLDASGTADLSVYTDVDPAAWYATELSAAVAAGIFNGTSATTFAPNKPLTREQAMVVLCRAFGITTESPKAYKEFTDGASVGEYARFAVGAMKELGIVKGYSDGSLKPQKTITRAEIAQLLYNLFDVIANTPAELPEEGRVLYRGTEPLPPVLTIRGTLILANGTPKDLQVENWNIEDTLVIRTQDGIQLDLSGLTAKRLVVCAGGEVTSSVDRVWLGGMAENGVTYRGNASYLGSLLGSHNAIGDYTSVLVRGGSIAIDGSALDLELSPDTQARVNSSSRNVTMSKRSVLQLDGSCDYAIVGPLANLTVTGSCNNMEAAASGKITIGGNCTTVSLGASSVLILGGSSDSITMNGYSKVTALGHVKHITLREWDTLVLNGTADNIIVEKANATISGTGHAKLITAHSRYYTCTLAVDTIDDVWYTPYVRDYDNALKTVQTMRVPCTVNYDTYLYANQNLTGYLVTLPKGATVYNERHPSDGTIKLSYTDKNGKTWIGWTGRNSCTIHTDTTTTNGNLDYSTGTKEGWVDKKGYASATDYLIWVNRYTQKVMVFKGSKGNWKLVKTMPCSSGSNYTPTPAGTYTIESRLPRWYFSAYYTDYVSVFYGGHAFHSIPMNYDDTVYEGRVGIPLSAGCVRMLMKDCEYIYNLPIGTTVVIW